MDTPTQRELRYRGEASRGYLVVRPVQDRVFVGLGMVSPVILSEEIMKDNEAHPMTTQIESERNLISVLSVTKSNPNSERSIENIENDLVLPRNVKIEAACYSLEFRGRHARSATTFPASLPSFVLRSVNYASRQLFFELYSYVKFISDANKKVRRFSDWNGNFRYVEVEGGLSPLLDTKVDNLYITNLFGRSILFGRYETSVDLTVLTVDIVNVQWMNFIPRAREQDAFLEIERLCPNLKRLFIVLNKIGSARDPRQLEECKYSMTSTQFLDFNQNFVDQLRYCQWIEPCKYYPNIKWEIDNSSRECSEILRNTGSNSGYWSRVDVKPVWMVHTVAYSVRRSRNQIPGPFLAVEISRYKPLHLRCNVDGTLSDQYDQIKEPFGGEDGGYTQPPVDGEALVVIDND